MSTATLLQAVTAREAARTKLDAAIEATGRARATADTAQAALNQLVAAERANAERHAERLALWTSTGSPGPAPALLSDANATQEKSAAEAMLRATRENLQRFESAAMQAQSELTAAEASVRAAAQSAARAEVRADFEELERVNAYRAELRERLFGAYLADQGALPDGDWTRVDTDGGFTAQQMNIGLPLTATSIYSQDAFGGDARPARRRVDAASARYEERLEELCAATAGSDATTAEEAAA